MNLQIQNLQTIQSVSNIENGLVDFDTKKSSEIFDKINFKKNQINYNELQQQLIQNRQIYLEQKKQEIADLKNLKKQENFKRRAEQSQGLIQHPKQFRQIFNSSDLFVPTQFFQNDKESKEMNKITFVPLKQKIQQSLADKKISQPAWISACSGQDAFDKNEIFKPTAEQEKTIIDQKEKFKQQRFDYKNFKNYLKTKFNNFYFDNQSNQNDEINQNQFVQQKSKNQSQEPKNNINNQIQPQIQRSSTASTGFRIKKSVNDLTKEPRTQSTERERIMNTNQYQNSQSQKTNRDSPKLVFKRLQSPQNVSLNLNSQFFGQLDQEQNKNKNFKLISMNIPQKESSNITQNPNIKQRIPLQKLNSQFYSNITSPINRVRSPQSTLHQQFNQTSFVYNQQNSPKNQFNSINQQNFGLQKTASSVSSHENGFHSRKQSHSLFNSTLQSLNQKQQSQQSTLTQWKYGYNNNNKINEIFSSYTVETNDYKMSQPRSPNFIFKPNGKLGNLFSDYYKDKGDTTNKSKQNFGVRNRVFSTSSAKKQLTSS